MRRTATRAIEPSDMLLADVPLAPAIAPNGRWVAYLLRSPDLEANKFHCSLRVLPADGSESGPGTEIAAGDSVHGWSPFQWAWAPDSSGITLLEPGNRLRLVDPDGDDRWCAGPDEVPGLAPANIGSVLTMALAPDGSCVALTSTGTPRAEEGPGRTSVPIDVTKLTVLDMYNQTFIEAQRDRGPGPVLVLDIRSRRVTEIGDCTVSVTGVSWAADGSRLVIRSAADGALEEQGRANRYLVDLACPLDWRLIEPSELDTASTVVSPDGSWVASQPLYPNRHFAAPTITKASSDDVAMAGQWNKAMAWSSDSEKLFFESQHRLAHRLFTVTPDQEEPTPFTPQDQMWHSHFSFAPDALDGRGLAAFLLESPNTPPDVWVTPLDEYRPLRLTNAAPELSELFWPEVRTLTWRSPDDRFDIDGVLLLPSKREEARPMPLVVEAIGGPAAVALTYTTGHAIPPQLLTAQDIAVLIPCTRGRGGGAYPAEFVEAIAHEGNQCRNPFGDLMEGVDLLVDEGIADPNRLGIMGHSYGATLTGWAVTQTDRFRAASAHEGGFDFVGRMQKDAGNAKTIAFCKTLSGYGDPMDPDEFSRIQADSPITHSRNASTPMLLVAGEKSGIAVETALMAHALEHNGVPYEFHIEPRSGHVTLEPALIDDLVRRNLAWFTYWLLDEPYPDSERQRWYDAWKSRSPVASCT